MTLGDLIKEVKDNGFEGSAVLAADWTQHAVAEDGKLRNAAQLCAECAVEAVIVGSAMLAHDIKDRRQSALYLPERSTQD